MSTTQNRNNRNKLIRLTGNTAVYIKDCYREAKSLKRKYLDVSITHLFNNFVQIFMVLHENETHSCNENHSLGSGKLRTCFDAPTTNAVENYNKQRIHNI